MRQTCAQEREEEDTELEQDDRDDDKVDGTAVYLLVNLGGLVDKVDVVAIHQVLHHQIQQPCHMTQ